MEPFLGFSLGFFNPEITVFNTLASLVSLMLLSVLATSPFTHHYTDDDARWQGPGFPHNIMIPDYKNDSNNPLLPGTCHTWLCVRETWYCVQVATHNQEGVTWQSQAPPLSILLLTLHSQDHFRNAYGSCQSNTINVKVEQPWHSNSPLTTVTAVRNGALLTRSQHTGILYCTETGISSALAKSKGPFCIASSWMITDTSLQYPTLKGNSSPENKKFSHHLPTLIPRESHCS